MPPTYRDPNRLFYDPVNPVMLSSEEMQQLGPQELQSATDQLDQHLILILQKIEENFAKCNQVVVEALLPAVEQHGENSARIYESIKFWRPFFEAAASIRLNEPYADETTTVPQTTTESNQSHDNNDTSQLSPDRTVSSVGEGGGGDETYSNDQRSIVSEEEGGGRDEEEEERDLEGTPRPTTKSSRSTRNDPRFESPLQDFDRPGGGGRLLPANSAMKQPTTATILPDLQRLRLRDLPPDSPDVPEPEFETAVFGGRGGSGGGDNKGKGRSFDLSSDPSSPSYSLLRDHTSPTPSTVDRSNVVEYDQPQRQQQSTRSGGGPLRGGGGDRAHSKLLDTILRKNFDSPAKPRTVVGPGSSTPGRGGGATTQSRHLKGSDFPTDLPREWNGIANLSTTSLDAFASPIAKRRQSNLTEDSFAHHLIVPPSTIRRTGGGYLTSSPAPPPGSHSHRLDQNPNFAPSPSKLSRTPAKQAARLTAKNVYDALGLDSPLKSPPSNTKLFDHHPSSYRDQKYGEADRSGEKEEEEEFARRGGGSRFGIHDDPGHSQQPREREASQQHRNFNDDDDRRRRTTREEEEDSFASSLPAHPSFINRSQADEPTRAFNLYEYTQQQQQTSSSDDHLRQRQRQEDDGRQERRLGDNTDRSYYDDNQGEDGVYDDRGGMTDNIDDLLAGHTMTYHQEQRMRASLAGGGGTGGGGMMDLGGIVDEDEFGREEGGDDDLYREEDEQNRRRGVEESYTIESQHEHGGEHDRVEDHQYRGGGNVGNDYEDEDSFVVEQRANQRGGGYARGLQDGPEDTLFGMPPARSQPHSTTHEPLQQQQQDDTFTDTQEPLQSHGGGRNGRGGGFRLHGAASDMETLHGGELLSSEPFQASPLAGRWNLGGGQ